MSELAHRLEPFGADIASLRAWSLEQAHVISVLLGPETKGKRLTADLEVIKGAALPAT